MSVTLSVTEVRNALRCARIFGIGRTLGQQVAFPVGASSLGATFHRLVERFARQAIEGAPAAVIEPDAPLEVLLEAWLLELLAEELVAQPALTTMPAEVDDLAEALRQFARYLAPELAATKRPLEEALAAFFRGIEAEALATIQLGDDVVVVQGRYDALHARPDGGHDVVEYKLTDDANDELDRAQVALYRHLIAASTGLDASAVVLRFSPALTATRLPDREADAIVQDRVLPLLGDMLSWIATPQAAPPPTRTDLCAACPVRAECRRLYPDWLESRDRPPAGAMRPRPERDGSLAEVAAAAVAAAAPLPSPQAGRADAGGDEEAAQLRARVLEVFKRRRVPAVIKQAMVGPRLISLEVSVSHGSIRAIDQAAEDVRHQLESAAGLRASFVKEGARRIFRAERRQPRRVELADLLARAEPWLRVRPGRFVVGELDDGEVLTGDFAEPTCPHLLVGGTTGSGKSVFLRALAMSLVHFHGPDAVQLTLVDPKRVSFQRLAAGLGAHLARPVAFDAEEVVPLLEGLVDEMEDRYAAFAEARVQDLEEHNESLPAHERLPRQVVIVDEFQDLVSKEQREPFFAAVRRLGAKARAAGIHLVLATQRPDREVIPGQIKANLPGRIALKVQQKLNSRIILDAAGAEELLGQGDLLADLGNGIVRAQAPFA